MDENSVFWIAAGVAVLVFVDILVVEVRRCIREGKRIVARLGAYGDLPIVSLAASGSHELIRLADALEEIAALLLRAQAALIAVGVLRAPNPTD